MSELDIITGQNIEADEDVLPDIEEDAFQIEEENDEDKRIDLSMGDLYIILLEDEKNPDPFLARIITISDTDQTVHFKSEKDDMFVFAYDDENQIMMKTPNYSVIEMIRVIDFNLVEDDYKPDDFDFETEIIEEKDKEYSEFIMKDDLLSQLIESMDIYDKPYLINKVQEAVNSIYECIQSIQNPPPKHKSSHWLIPITDDTMKRYNYEDKGDQVILDDGYTIEDEINEELETEDINNYTELIINHLGNCKPILNKNSIGYVTDNYKGTFLRNCIQSENCYGVNGNYAYDERRTRNPIEYTELLINEKNEYITIRNELLPSDTLNIIGYLQEPYHKMYYSLHSDIMNDFTLHEKCKLNSLNEQLQLKKKKIIGETPIINHLIDTDTMNLTDDLFISHTFNRKMNDEDLKQTLLNNLPNSETLLNYLLDTSDISDKLMNYSDIEKCLCKYNLKYDDLLSDERNIIDTKLKQNIKTYIKDYIQNVKMKLKRPLTEHKKELTIEKRISLAYDYIFSLHKVSEKNKLLEQFINLFTRTSDKKSENNHWLYNKFTNKKILCRHYLYSIRSENHNDVFSTMKTIFGLPPKDGTIYCKVCGEYLCDEEDTLFEGFDDGNNVMQSKEVLQQDTDQKDISEILTKKKTIVKYIQLISSFIGVEFTDEDTYQIVLLYDNMNQDELAELRYGMKGVSDSDIHPMIQKRLKSMKDKKDKKGKLNIIKEFQLWLKETNKLLMIVSLVSLYIQTSVPSFNFRKSLSFQIINKDKKGEFVDSGIQYLIAKIKKLCSVYKEDSFWTNAQLLVADETESIESQLKRSIQYCLSPIFPSLIQRMKKYETFIQSEKNLYLRQEWVNYKPLQNNALIQSIHTVLNEIENEKYLKKLYNGYLIENISLIREMNDQRSISEICDIPQFQILNNSSFKKLFRYVVSCYGIHENNILITMILQRLLNTIDKPDEIVSIFKKYGWKEDTQSFPKLSFQDLRQHIMPQILGLYSKENTEIKSCFTSESNCNNYIHTLINNYDLHLLNTKPKRIYHYEPPVVYPEETFDDLPSDIKDALFDKYKVNNVGDIVISNMQVQGCTPCSEWSGQNCKKKESNEKQDNESFLNQYLLDLHVLEPEHLKGITYKTLEKNEENYLKILQSKRLKGELVYRATLPEITNYQNEDYQFIKTLSLTDTRFFKYLQMKDKTDFEEELLNTIGNYLNDDQKDKTQWNQRYSNIFSKCIEINSQSIERISSFIVQSDRILDHQKKRFATIFKESDSKKKIIFKSEQISQILKTFIEDKDFTTEYLINYLKNIQNIMIHIQNKDTQQTKLPKEWNLTDSVRDSYQRFLTGEGIDGSTNRYELLLHNRIFMKSKDTYSGFNNYNSVYILGLYKYVESFFQECNGIIGDEDSMFTNKYSTYYSKYLFIGFFTSILDYIDGLKDDQSDICKDANDLFVSLEERDDELIEESITECSRFLMDILTHILLSHYDISWIYLCHKSSELSKSLSKQRENEKQRILSKKSEDDRDQFFAKKELNKMGMSLYFKQAAKEYSELIETEEYADLNENERRERYKEIFGELDVDVSLVDTTKNTEEVGEDYHEDRGEEDFEDGGLDEELDQVFEV